MTCLEADCRIGRPRSVSRKNDAAFRAANERIGAFAAEHDLSEDPLPFICECADMRCQDIVRLRLDEYRRVRSNPAWFLNVDGHEAAALGIVIVVERHDAYVIVEKQGHAREVVEDLERGRGEESDG